jgi:hypothetical protein
MATVEGFNMLGKRLVTGGYPNCGIFESQFGSSLIERLHQDPVGAVKPTFSDFKGGVS